MHSIPSMRGMVRSMVTTSGSVRLNSSIASTPLPAVPTSCRSSNCCERSMRRRMMFESSTIISFLGRLPFITPTSGDRGGLSGRERDLEARVSAGVRADADLAAEGVDAARHHVHPDAAARIHRHLVLRGEAGAEDERHGGARVHGGRLQLGDELLAHGGGLERIGGDAGAVVLEQQVEAVIRALEVDADDTDILLGVR